MNAGRNVEGMQHAALPERHYKMKGKPSLRRHVFVKHCKPRRNAGGTQGATIENAEERSLHRELQTKGKRNLSRYGIPRNHSQNNWNCNEF